MPPLRQICLALLAMLLLACGGGPPLDPAAPPTGGAATAEPPAATIAAAAPAEVGPAYAPPSSGQAPAYPAPTAAFDLGGAAYPAPTLVVPPAGVAPTVDPGRQIAATGFNLAVSPDSRYVVYIADDDRDRVYDLYSARLDGVGAARLNTSSPPRDMIFRFAITPDSRGVVFQADRGQLYYTSIEGGQPRELAPPADEFLISPDGQWVVYTQFGSGLYGAPIGGGPPLRLGDSPNQSDQVAFTPDSRRVVWVQGGQRGGDPYRDELHSAPIGGGSSTCLSCTSGQARRVLEFAVTADSQMVVYTTMPAPQDFQMLSLAGVPVDGGSPALLWDASQGGPADMWFSLSPDGAMVVFTAGRPGEQRVYAVPVGGGAAVALSEPLAAQVSILGVSVAGGRAVFAAQQTGDSSPELYSAALTGGPALRLSGPRPFGDGRLFWQLAPRRELVVFGADLDSLGEVGLYSVPVGGGAPTVLNAGQPLALTGVQLTADERVVVYGLALPGQGADPILASVHAHALDTGRSRVLADGSGLTGFLVAPDGRSVVYVADRDADGHAELYVVPTADVTP